MIDVLFVHPNASNLIYQDLSRDFSSIEPPIWAAMLAKYIQNRGYSVALLDCEAERLNYDQSLIKIKEFNAKIVCLVVYGQQPSASTQNMTGAMALMSRLKDEGVIRIYTGPHPSALPQKTIQDDPDVFVCKGEGPKTLSEFIKITDYNDNAQLSKVPGLWYRNRDTNVIMGNAPAPLFEDLDNELDMLPIEFIDFSKYRTSSWHGWENNCETSPFASIYTSLGCPFHCQFCMINSPFNNGDNKNNKFRHWSPKVIIEKLGILAGKGIVNLKMADEMFVLKKDHFLELCKLIIERDYKFNIWAYARIDTVKEEYLEILKKAGVNYLGLGIESANLKIRKEVTKGKFEETNIKNIVEKITQYKINANGNYIFGLPEDTMETMQETLDMVLELPTAYVNLYCTQAYPGSELHRVASKNAPELLPENNNIGWIGYSQHSYESFPLSTKYLKNSEILNFRDKAFIKYYSSPAFIGRMSARYGQKFINDNNKMLSITLKRKLLGD